MKLYLDLGNSRIKWQLEQQTMQFCDWKQAHVLEKIWQQVAIDQVYMVATVGAEKTQQLLANAALKQAKQHQFSSLFPWASVRQGYRQPKQLGDDRWAALIATRALYEGNCCIISAGTAITVDFLAGAQHVPGLIMPGEQLMRTILQQKTAIPSQQVSWTWPADNTQQCIQAGMDLAVCGAITSCSKIFQKHHGKPLKYILTGGAASHLQALLPEESTIVPDLIIKGLQIAYCQ